MMTIELPYAGAAIDDMAAWLELNLGGPTRDLPDGGIGGCGWRIYHTTVYIRKHASLPLPHPVTHAEIDDDRAAVLFRLRWA